MSRFTQHFKMAWIIQKRQSFNLSNFALKAWLMAIPCHFHSPQTPISTDLRHIAKSGEKNHTNIKNPLATLTPLHILHHTPRDYNTYAQEKTMRTRCLTSHTNVVKNLLSNPNQKNLQQHSIHSLKFAESVPKR